MAAGDYRIGLDGKFYSGTAGSTATTERSNVDDVALNLSKRVAEAIRRGKKWVAIKPTVTEATVEFVVFDIDSDPFVAALESAFINDTRIALYPRDAAGGKGLNADYYITQFSRQEDNEDFIKYSVQARPTDELRDPTWA